MPGSAWDVTKPADTDLVRNYPTLARQDKSTVKLQMEVEHHAFDAAGAGAAFTGRHKFPVGGTANRPPSSPIIPGEVYYNHDDLAVVEMQSGVDGSWFDVATKVHVGSIMIWPLTALPIGYLECNGQAVSRTTFARLFTAISTIYGAGDGSTTFNVPNLAGRVVVGFQSADPDFGVMAQTGGAKTHTLATGEIPAHSHGVTDPTHAHGVTDPTHSHTVPVKTNLAGAAVVDVAPGVNAPTVNGPTSAVGTGLTVNAASTGITSGSAGGGGAHNNIQPYMVMKYIIKI